LPPGTVLQDRYLVGRALGEGGFGITYIGCDLQLELKVAIKEYFPTDKAGRMTQASLDVVCYAGGAEAGYHEGLDQFLQEARTIARMNKQPVIVDVRDFFEANRTAYIVMEYVEGITFKELVEQRGGRIPAGELLCLIEPLFSALKEMHANGLIHRDISPENLMLEKGKVRLLDFGCARDPADGGSTLTVSLKHGYAPVEQYQSRGQGPWTDVYALSATVYYCLTGCKPPQALDRLVEDDLIQPRKLGVDLPPWQEKALLRGMGVRPKKRFPSVEELHCALYEGAASADEAAEASGQEDTDERPFGLAAWLKRNRLLAGGIAAALALAILAAAVLPRLFGPGQAAPPGPAPTEEVETKPGAEQTGEPAPAIGPNADCLAQVMETVEWLRQDDLELDEAELRAKLDALPIDELFADAVHVTTLNELDAALAKGESGKPIVIDGDIVLNDGGRGSMLPVLISEGASVTVPWNSAVYENGDISEDSHWTVDGSILVNRGTLRGGAVMGDWDNDGTVGTNLLLNYGTLYSSFGAGYSNDSYNVVVNLGTVGHLQGQFRQTSFYNLGTLLHGAIAPEGETPMILTARGGDYFIDLIGSYFYNSGEIVLEGLSGEVRGRLDVGRNSRFANRGTIRLGDHGEINNHAALLNHGEIAAAESTGAVNNEGWLWNSGEGCALDENRVNNVGLVQAGPETVVDLSAVWDGKGGAVLRFGWPEAMEQPEGHRFIASEEEFYQALADRDCEWIVLGGASLTLTEDVVLTKGLAVSATASLTMDGASLTVAGEDGRLCSDGPIDLRGGVFTVRDDAVASVAGLIDCGGITLRNNGYLLARDGLRPNDGAVIQLSNAHYLCSIGLLELHGTQVRIEGGLVRGTGGIELYGCAVDIGEEGCLMTSGCGLRFDPDTVITNYGTLEASGWDTQEFGCQLTNYGVLRMNEMAVLSGTIVSHGHLGVWGGEGALIRVSGSLENHGEVEFYSNSLRSGGQFQPWAAGTITGVPLEYVAG